MLRRAFSSSAKVVWLAALGAALLIPTAAHAQADKLGSSEELNKLRRDNLAKFERLIKGEEQPAAGDEPVLDAFAQWYVYRVSWTDYQISRDKLHQVSRDLEGEIKIHALEFAPKNQEFMKQWTARMIAAFRKALELKVNDNRVTIVNVAMLLPVYAKTRQEAFGEYLEGLLADEKQHDVVKLYALKALRAYLPARPSKLSDDPEEPVYKQIIAPRIARDTRRVQAVLKFLDRKWDNVDPAVIRFIRREALRTLADTEVPAMFAVKGKVVAPVAYALIRTLSAGKDAPNPAPSLTEKCEAAIGVCRIKAKDIEDYQPEVGVYLVGRLLIDFITEYTKDYATFGGKGKGTKVITVVPWRLEAEGLQKALDQLDANLPIDRPIHAKAMALVKEARSFLSTIKAYSRVEQPTILRRLVDALAPPTGALFKGAKEYHVDLSQPAGD